MQLAYHDITLANHGRSGHLSAAQHSLNMWVPSRRVVLQRRRYVVILLHISFALHRGKVLLLSMCLWTGSLSADDSFRVFGVRTLPTWIPLLSFFLAFDRIHSTVIHVCLAHSTFFLIWLRVVGLVLHV